MRFQPHLAEGFESREAMRTAAIEMRLAGHSRSQIAKALGFRSGGRSLSEWLRDVPPPDWTKRPRAKDHLREIAVAMRLEGRSYREIKGVLGVSKSSLSLWLRNVPLSEEHRLLLEERRLQGALLAAETLRARRDATERRVMSEARDQIPTIAESELFIAGVVAYWAEGAKEKPWNRKGRVRFMNSDPGLIALFLQWLGLIGVPEELLSFRLSIHERADIESATRFWSRVVGFPDNRFHKPMLKSHNPKTTRKNLSENYRGCLEIEVRKSLELYRRIAGWFEGIALCLERDASGRRYPGRG